MQRLECIDTDQMGISPVGAARRVLYETYSARVRIQADNLRPYGAVERLLHDLQRHVGNLCYKGDRHADPFVHC